MKECQILITTIVALNNTTDEQAVNTTNVALEEAIREQMWYEIVRQIYL